MKKIIAYETEGGLLTQRISHAAYVEFKEAITKEWPDNITSSEEIDLELLWDDFDELHSLRKTILENAFLAANSKPIE